MTTENATLFVWAIEDGEATDWYVASSADEARKMHRRVRGAVEEERDEYAIRRLDDADELSMDEDRDEEGEPIYRTAREWAERNGPGMLMTSDY